MKKQQTLKDSLWAVAVEYAERVAVILGMSVEFWVAEDISVSVCCFGDVEFLNLEEMQIIVDHLDMWVEKYGSEEKVGEAVLDWLHWCLDEATEPKEVDVSDHPRINLWSWLKGLRPDDIKKRP